VHHYEFDVALSFATEDRAFVAEIAHGLRSAGVRVFYDDFELVDLWGRDLVDYLEDVYRHRSRFAVVFASEHYAKKMWTAHERRSVQSRALDETGPYLLPVRLDDAEIPGLLPTVGYIDARRYAASDITALIVEKVAMTPSGWDQLSQCVAEATDIVTRAIGVISPEAQKELEGWADRVRRQLRKN